MVETLEFLLQCKHKLTNTSSKLYHSRPFHTYTRLTTSDVHAAMLMSPHCVLCCASAGILCFQFEGNEHTRRPESRAEQNEAKDLTLGKEDFSYR